MKRIKLKELVLNKPVEIRKKGVFSKRTRFEVLKSWDDFWVDLYGDILIDKGKGNLFIFKDSGNEISLSDLSDLLFDDSCGHNLSSFGSWLSYCSGGKRTLVVPLLHQITPNYREVEIMEFDQNDLGYYMHGDYNTFFFNVAIYDTNSDSKYFVLSDKIPELKNGESVDVFFVK